MSVEQLRPDPDEAEERLQRAVANYSRAVGDKQTATRLAQLSRERHLRSLPRLGRRR